MPHICTHATHINASHAPHTDRATHVTHTNHANHATHATHTDHATIHATHNTHATHINCINYANHAASQAGSAPPFPASRWPKQLPLPFAPVGSDALKPSEPSSATCPGAHLRSPCAVDTAYPKPPSSHWANPSSPAGAQRPGQLVTTAVEQAAQYTTLLPCKQNMP
ncbi:hypothetical protein P7K49_024730, partial [Saguinus oedipus]